MYGGRGILICYKTRSNNRYINLVIYCLTSFVHIIIKALSCWSLDLRWKIKLQLQAYEQYILENNVHKMPLALLKFCLNLDARPNSQQPNTYGIMLISLIYVSSEGAYVNYSDKDSTSNFEMFTATHTGRRGPIFGWTNFLY